MARGAEGLTMGAAKADVLARLQNFVGAAPDLLVREGLMLDGRRNRSPHREYLERLEHYARLRQEREGALFSGLPRKAPALAVAERRPFGEGEQTLLTFTSSYETLNPAMASAVAACAPNRTAYLFLWRHEASRPRPLVLCAHGFLMGEPRRAMRLFRVERLFRSGLDVALFIQPHHWKRADDPRNPFRQRFINPHDVPFTIEALGQSVHDLRASYLLLEQLGHERIALVGASLGGYSCALYAAADDSPACVFVAVPALRLDRSLAPRRLKLGFAVDDELRGATRRALELVAPANYPPRLPAPRIQVVYHEADRIADVSYTREWIERWGITHQTALRGGHWAAFDRKARGRAFYGWLHRHGFDPTSDERSP